MVKSCTSPASPSVTRIRTSQRTKLTKWWNLTDTTTTLLTSRIWWHTSTDLTLSSQWVSIMLVWKGILFFVTHHPPDIDPSTSPPTPNANECRIWLLDRLNVQVNTVFSGKCFSFTYKKGRSTTGSGFIARIQMKTGKHYKVLSFKCFLSLISSGVLSHELQAYGNHIWQHFSDVQWVFLDRGNYPPSEFI